MTKLNKHIKDTVAELDITLDAFFEANVADTNSHPNCKYVFTCREVNRFKKLFRQDITQALKDTVKVAYIQGIDDLNEYIQKGGKLEKFKAKLKKENEK